MKKRILAIFLLSAFLLAACNGAAGTPDADAPAAETESEVGSENADEAPAAEDSSAAEGTTDSTATEEDKPYTDVDNPCLPFSVLDVSLSTPYPGLPEVTEEDYVIGPDDAIMTFMVYSEPQCPYCAQFDPILDAFQAMYPDEVRVVFRLRPFQESFHDKSYIASQAMVAAGMQGKFNEFKAFIFERQYQDPNVEEQASMSADEFWGSISADDFDAWLEERVSALGLDYDQLKTDMYSDEVVNKVKAFGDDASAIGITGTPSLFVNGYQWAENSRGIDIFTIYLRLFKNRAVEMDECAPTVIDENKTYSATISTTKGDIEVDLFADKAPLAVNSFVYLTQQGWYDNLPILSSSEFVLSGDPSDTGYGGAGYAYMDEPNDLSFEEPGMLAVYSIWPGYGYNGSMFFINKTALAEQDSRVIFGQVTEGMDIVESITMRSNIFETVQDEVLGITINEK